LGTSVVAEDCITADAYATSFMAMPLEKSIELISKLKNIDGMIIYFDKKKNVQVFTTKGFDKLILN
jgi:thiamine biosynthesis lipoprotein